jgi:hypothetical protein
MKRILFFGSGALLLLTLLLLAACPQPTDDPPDDPPAVIDAAAPTINVQPQGGQYETGASNVAPLRVTASVSDGGTLGYQWHSAPDNTAPGTVIAGATESGYTPPVTATGTVYYYVVVSNTNTAATGAKTATVASSRAAIVVTTGGQGNGTTPVINVQPQSAQYEIGAAAVAPLTVTASVSGGGPLTYQWHSAANATDAGTVIEGATGSSYTPPVTATGTVYYYVVVTNPNAAGAEAAVASNRVSVAVDPKGAKAPVISVQPQGGSYATGASAVEPLTVTASVSDGGTLSYQWHSAPNATTAGTAIPGATGSSYTPPVDSVGTLYYYVVVTNTNNAAPGAKTRSITSARASVRVGLGDASVGFSIPDFGPGLFTGASLSISKTGGNSSLSLTAEAGWDAYEWYLGRDAVGNTAGLALNAADYKAGTYTLTLIALKDGRSYSKSVTLTVAD